MCKISKEEHIAYECDDCGSIQIYKSKNSDGVRCVKCKGYLFMLGQALLVSRLDSNILTVGVKVDTMEVDEAISKLKTMIELQDKVSLKIGGSNG